MNIVKSQNKIKTRVKKQPFEIYNLQTFPSVFTDALARDVVTSLAMTRVAVTRVGAADAKTALK